MDSKEDLKPGDVVYFRYTSSDGNFEIARNEPGTILNKSDVIDAYRVRWSNSEGYMLHSRERLASEAEAILEGLCNG